LGEKDLDLSSRNQDPTAIKYLTVGSNFSNQFRGSHIEENLSLKESNQNSLLDQFKLEQSLKNFQSQESSLITMVKTQPDQREEEKKEDPITVLSTSNLNTIQLGNIFAPPTEPLHQEFDLTQYNSPSFATQAPP